MELTLWRIYHCLPNAVILGLKSIMDYGSLMPNWLGSYSIKFTIWLLKFAHPPRWPLVSTIPQDNFCLQSLFLHKIYLISMWLRKVQVWTSLCISTHRYKGNLSCLARSRGDETTLRIHKASGTISLGLPLDPIMGKNLRIIRGNYVVSSLPHTRGLGEEITITHT